MLALRRAAATNPVGPAAEAFIAARNSSYETTTPSTGMKRVREANAGRNTGLLEKGESGRRSSCNRVQFGCASTSTEDMPT